MWRSRFGHSMWIGLCTLILVAPLVGCAGGGEEAAEEGAAIEQEDFESGDTGELAAGSEEEAEGEMDEAEEEDVDDEGEEEDPDSESEGETGESDA